MIACGLRCDAAELEKCGDWLINSIWSYCDSSEFGNFIQGWTLRLDDVYGSCSWRTNDTGSNVLQLDNGSNLFRFQATLNGTALNSHWLRANHYWNVSVFENGFYIQFSDPVHPNRLNSLFYPHQLNWNLWNGNITCNNDNWVVTPNVYAPTPHPQTPQPTPQPTPHPQMCFQYFGCYKDESSNRDFNQSVNNAFTDLVRNRGLQEKYFSFMLFFISSFDTL